MDIWRSSKYIPEYALQKKIKFSIKHLISDIVLDFGNIIVENNIIPFSVT